MVRPRKRHSRQERESIVSEFQSSSLSVLSFAHSRGLNPYTLRGWIQQKRNIPVNAFVPVHIEATPISSRGAGFARLCSGGNYALEIPLNANPKWVAEILEALK